MHATVYTCTHQLLPVTGPLAIEMAQGHGHRNHRLSCLAVESFGMFDRPAYL